MEFSSSQLSLFQFLPDMVKIKIIDEHMQKKYKKISLKNELQNYNYFYDNFQSDLFLTIIQMVIFKSIGLF